LFPVYSVQLLFRVIQQRKTSAVDVASLNSLGTSKDALRTQGQDQQKTRFFQFQPSAPSKTLRVSMAFQQKIYISVGNIALLTNVLINVSVGNTALVTNVSINISFLCF
jgi:hypothetical protein